MLDFEAIAQKIPFSIDYFVSTETGQAQLRKNDDLDISWYWHEIEGDTFTLDNKQYPSLPELLKNSPTLAKSALENYGV